MTPKSSLPPEFDPATAVAVEPARHESTGRTYAFTQGPHLFSATGVYVATLANAPEAPRPKPATK